MILLQSTIFLMMGIIAFLILIVLPIIITVRMIKHTKDIEERKITKTNLILILLKNLLFATTIVTIIGFFLFLLIDIL